LRLAEACKELASSTRIHPLDYEPFIAQLRYAFPSLDPGGLRNLDCLILAYAALLQEAHGPLKALLICFAKLLPRHKAAAPLMKLLKTLFAQQKNCMHGEAVLSAPTRAMAEYAPFRGRYPSRERYLYVQTVPRRLWAALPVRPS
jgi:hypothetical protein